MLPQSFVAVPGGQIVWNVEHGLGYAPPVPSRMSDNRIQNPDDAREVAHEEEIFARMRREFVDRTVPGLDWENVVDVNFGDRAFAASTGCKVFELRHGAADILRARGRYHDLTGRFVDYACFWDCLDRFIEPSELLRHVRKVAFVSLPLHHSIDALPQSAYYELGRRYYYWTHAGFAHYVEQLGFESLGGAYVVANLRPKGIVGVALRRVSE